MEVRPVVIVHHDGGWGPGVRLGRPHCHCVQVLGPICTIVNRAPTSVVEMLLVLLLLHVAATFEQVTANVFLVVLRQAGHLGCQGC